MSEGDIMKNFWGLWQLEARVTKNEKMADKERFQHPCASLFPVITSFPYTTQGERVQLYVFACGELPLNVRNLGLSIPLVIGLDSMERFHRWNYSIHRTENSHFTCPVHPKMPPNSTPGGSLRFEM